ncbi:hypothetical protein ACE0DR_11865 [Azotobacter sp. CWF10]
MEVSDLRIAAVRASAYRIPAERPEADGTFRWEATTLVLVEVEAGGRTGLGYTYADASLLRLIDDSLGELVVGANPIAPARVSGQLWARVRNLGRAGLAACAISALDTALWDLKARLLDLPLATLLGRCRDNVRVYGSGGFSPTRIANCASSSAAGRRRTAAAG